MRSSSKVSRGNICSRNILPHQRILSNNRGIELSINFAVVLILSIIILGLGIYLYTQINVRIQDLVEEVSQEAKDDIFSALDKSQGDLVFIPTVIKEISLGDNAHFPIGIKAQTKECGGSDAREAQFTVTMKPDIVVDEKNKVVAITNELKTNMQSWYFTEPLEITVRNNDKEVIDRPIRAGIGAKKGYSYGFDLKISCDSSNPDAAYGGKSHKLIIVVE